MNAPFPKLSADARSALRKAITGHEGWSGYRALHGVSIDQLTTEGLFAAASSLSIDVAAIVDQADASDDNHKPRPHGRDEVKALYDRITTLGARGFLSEKDSAFSRAIFTTIHEKQDGAATVKQFRVLEKIAVRSGSKSDKAGRATEAPKATAAAPVRGDLFAATSAPAAATIPAPAAPVANDAASQLASLIAQMAGSAINPETVARIVDERINAALASIPSIKIECKGVDGATRTIDGHQHPEFKRLLTAAASRNVDGHHPNIWLAGPAGSGKTHAGKMVAKALGLPFVFNGALANAFELLGFIDAGGTYHRTAFREAFEHGGVYMFDEVDGSDNSALLALNAALANGAAQFPDGRIERHADCVILASANTWGLGATAEYVGRSKIDAAFLDRFGVRFNWQYDTALETAISGNEGFARRVIAAREKARSAGLKVLITPRASQAGAALVAAGMSYDEAASLTYLANLTADQRRIVEG
jgi:cobaltochelatase CobS